MLVPSTLGAFTVEVVRDETRFAEIRGEWESLWHRAEAPRQSQSFDWAWRAWRICAPRLSRRLWILVLRDKGRAVLIWPMTLRCKAGCRIAEELGSESAEYDPLLTEQGAAAGDYLDTAWTEVERNLPADIVHVPLVTVGSRREAILARAARMRVVDRMPSPVASLGDGWAAYWSSRTKNLRKSSDRCRRRLEEIGEVESRWITSQAEIATIIDAMLRQKLKWMKIQGLNNGFIGRREFRDLLITMASTATGCGQMRINTLSLAGQAIAIELGSDDGNRFESYVSTYDPEYSAFSPGTLLQIETMKWCASRRLDYDMRIGQEDYKSKWATQNATVANYDVTLTWYGAIYLALRASRFAIRHGRNRLRNAVPVDLRRRLKPVLRRLAR